MPRLFIATAVAALLAAPGFAQDAQTAEPPIPAAETTAKAQAADTATPAATTPERKSGCSHAKQVNS